MSRRTEAARTHLKQAWHSLVPERPLSSDAALQDAFAKLDLDGNGHLDARELKQALLCAASKTVSIEVDIDDRVDEMIGWADMSDDGVVTFEVRVRPPPLPKART